MGILDESRRPDRKGGETGGLPNEYSVTNAKGSQRRRLAEDRRMRCGARAGVTRGQHPWDDGRGAG
ncbi:hypothetical protein GQF56_25355, partial [Rhodobacter sphaeroides]|nr:hypothetical protein [Cereibacter sphaeroides]